MNRVSDIAMAHSMQGTQEMSRVIVKHLPAMRLAKSLKPSVSSLFLLRSAVHAEAIEKNKKCLQEGFGEKTDPRLDSFIDYLVSNKVSHTLVETAINEQIACVDPKDQHVYIHKDIQQSARMINKTVVGCDTLAELANWHKCYEQFRTATGLFIMGIDYLVHSEYELSLACLVECYLVNKRLEGMTPKALNRYKTMNRKGCYINLCIQYCNEALINRFKNGFEARESMQSVFTEVLSIITPAINILMEKAIVFPSGEAGKSMKAIKEKWEDIEDEHCKKTWMDIIENALSDNIGSLCSITKQSKDRREEIFQKDTGILALNKFYAGYMDIVRQWNADIVEMVLVVTNMSRLDFNKKFAEQQKWKEFKVLGWEPAVKKTGIHAMCTPMPRGRGRGIHTQVLPPVPVGRGRGQGGSVGSTKMQSFGDIMANPNKSKTVSAELDKKESLTNNHQVTLPEDKKLSKKERKRRRKQLERQQRMENTEDVKVTSVIATDSRQQPAREGKLDDEEFELFGKLFKKLCKTRTITGETDITHNQDQFEDIAEEVIKRAEKEFETKLTQIHLLQKEKESLQNELLSKGKEVLFHKDNTDKFMNSKSSLMLEIAANLDKSADEKEKNDKEIEEISAKIEMFNLKKLSLSSKQNVIFNRIKDLLEDRETVKTSVNLKATETYIIINDIKRAINGIEINIKEVDENITAAKLFKPQVQNVPKTENPNSKLIQFLEKSIQSKEKQLECPLCFHIAKAPIFSCSESHMVCGNCRPKLKICPECRCGYKEQKRHRYAEMLAKELDILRQERDELGSVRMS